jgi:hypothetical protein
MLDFLLYHIATDISMIKVLGFVFRSLTTLRSE